MPADLNRHMSPVRVQDMKAIVVHKGHRLLPFQVVIGIDIPHRGLGTPHQNEKYPSLDFCLLQVLLGHLVLVFPRPAIHHRNLMGSGIASQATAEPAGQPHQEGPIYTVITACYNIPIECAQSIAHAAHLTRTTPCFATAPRGPLFRSAVCEKAYIVTWAWRTLAGPDGVFGRHSRNNGAEPFVPAWRLTKRYRPRKARLRR